jgi:phosphopantetheine--protein transferase-like protein
MIQEGQLREIVGHLLQLRPEDVTAGTALNGILSGSIGRARLDAALRNKLGSSRTEIYTVATYGQLAEAICDSESIVPDPRDGRERMAEAKPVRAAEAVHHHDVGIDIEAIGNLPKVTDYWDSPFYKSHFSNTEIGYCMLQPKPLETFAGLWSAKEALRKTSHNWAHLDWKEIEVAHDPKGSPYLVVQGADLRPEYSASISHTPEFSVAVVVRVLKVESQRGISITGPTRTAPAEMRSLTKSIRPISLLIFTVLLISIWYIIQTHKW